MGLQSVGSRWVAPAQLLPVSLDALVFAQAATVLLDPLALTVFDETHSDWEDRWFTLGWSQDGRLLAVAHKYVTESSSML